MDRDERVALVVEALTRTATDDHNVVQFEDMDQEEHWVRVWDFGTGPTTHLEVTHRAIPGSRLPPLTRKQVDRLVALGVGPEARPNFEGDVPDTDARAIAERVERIFEVLRSKEDFDLAAGLGHGVPPTASPEFINPYGGLAGAPDWNDEAWGDSALLDRIKEAQARYRRGDGEVEAVPPPHLVTCMDFGDEYGLFAGEEAIMLRAISLAMQSGSLTGEQAREAYRPYAQFQPEIYGADFEDWNDWGFPVCTDDMDELSVSIITAEADAAGIPGVGVPWHDLHPMSGEPLQVEGDEALNQLRSYFEGRYIIVCTGTEEWWDLPPDEAQHRIEAARDAERTSFDVG